MALMRRPVCLSGHVTDAVTGVPVAATITYLDVPFENDETNSSDERWGRYHAFMPAGTYALEFTADGYFPEYRIVDIISGQSRLEDVFMVPSLGLVDMADFAALAACWHKNANGECSIADLTEDGLVDFSDLKILADNWLTGSPVSTLAK